VEKRVWKSVTSSPDTVEGDSFHPKMARPWTEGPVVEERGNLRGYDRDKVVFVFNFFDELSRTVAAAER
jgi:hypothetical protein